MATAAKKVASSRQAIAKEKTKDALLRVAIGAIDEAGEANVRLEDVLRDANASVSSLYHHYGNMRGLLDEAQLARFHASSGENVREFANAANRVKNKKELRELVIRIVRESYSPERARNRATSLNAFSSILDTPEYNEKVAGIERVNIDLLIDALDSLRARDLISKSLDLTAFAAWIMGLRFARVVPDTMNDANVEEAWIDITTRAVLHLLEL